VSEPMGIYTLYSAANLHLIHDRTLIVTGFYQGAAWTNLAKTALAGQNVLVLKEAVYWKAGGIFCVILFI
jgi:hypothetical protein